MKAKLFEVRDRGTFIPIVAIRCDPADEAERYLLSRAGYGKDADSQRQYILVGKIDGGECGVMNYDPFAWTTLTMREAHLFLQRLGQNFDDFEKLPPGSVIDVEYLRLTLSRPS